MAKAFRVTVPTLMRAGFDMLSAEVRMLQTGETLVVTETKRNKKGQLRIHGWLPSAGRSRSECEEGWVSQTSGKGVELLEALPLALPNGKRNVFLLLKSSFTRLP